MINNQIKRMYFTLIISQDFIKILILLMFSVTPPLQLSLTYSGAVNKRKFFNYLQYLLLSFPEFILPCSLFPLL